jgi:hypothetical protein
MKAPPPIGLGARAERPAGGKTGRARLGDPNTHDIAPKSRWVCCIFFFLNLWRGYGLLKEECDGEACSVSA